MFLVRRRADSKWWRNAGYHSRKSDWTDTPWECKPFMSKSGARNALNCFCYVKLPPDVYGHRRLRLDRSLFGQKFELIPMKLMFAED